MKSSSISKVERVTKAASRSSLLQISMPTSLTCTSHLIPTNPISLLGIRPKWHKHTNNITFVKTEAETIEWAKKARGKEVAKLLKQIKDLPDKDAPVFVVGRFQRTFTP